MADNDKITKSAESKDPTKKLTAKPTKKPTAKPTKKPTRKGAAFVAQRKEEGGAPTDF